MFQNEIVTMHKSRGLQLLILPKSHKHSRVHAAEDVDCVAPFVDFPVPQLVQEVAVSSVDFQVFTGQAAHVPLFM